jgi:hypothetical protein
VWPLLLLTLTLGATAAVRGAREQRANGIPLVAYATLVVAAGALCIGLVRYNARGYQQQWWATAQRAVARQLLPLVDWAQRNTLPADVIASDGDPLLHLYTGRHVVPSARWAIETYPAGADSASRLADLRELLATYKPRYLLLSSNKSPSAPATAILRSSQLELQLLTTLPGGGAAFTTAPDPTRE